MNVFAVIVLLMTLNLLSCAKIDRATMTAAEAATRTSAAAAISPTMSTTPNEFLNSPTGTKPKAHTHTAHLFGLFCVYFLPFYAIIIGQIQMTVVVELCSIIPFDYFTICK